MLLCVRRQLGLNRKVGFFSIFTTSNLEDDHLLRPMTLSGICHTLCTIINTQYFWLVHVMILPRHRPISLFSLHDARDSQIVLAPVWKMECEEIIKYTQVFIIEGGLKICDDDSCIQVPGIDSCVSRCFEYFNTIIVEY